MDKYIEHSQLRKVWFLKLKSKRNQFKATMSNLMRALLLHKYGGSYLDMDTISIKSFPKDVSNFVIDGENFHS